MKAPGVAAKKTGKKLKRGQALQIMTYPRANAKKALVDASRVRSVCISVQTG